MHSETATIQGWVFIKDPIVKTIFLRIFSYSTSDVDGKIGSVFGGIAALPHFWCKWGIYVTTFLRHHVSWAYIYY